VVVSDTRRVGVEASIGCPLNMAGGPEKLVKAIEG